MGCGSSSDSVHPARNGGRPSDFQTGKLSSLEMEKLSKLEKTLLDVQQLVEDREKKQILLETRVEHLESTQKTVHQKVEDSEKTVKKLKKRIKSIEDRYEAQIELAKTTEKEREDLPIPNDTKESQDHDQHENVSQIDQTLKHEARQKALTTEQQIISEIGNRKHKDLDVSKQSTPEKEKKPTENNEETSDKDTSTPAIPIRTEKEHQSRKHSTTDQGTDMQEFVVIDTTNTKGQDLSPRPPKKKKKEIVPDTSVFSHIDAHALEAPNELRSNMKDLVNYLIQPTSSDLEKVRAFYRWITNNISYDADSFFSGERRDNSPSGVLASGRSVCEGYARLFEEFCRLVEVPVKKISGYAKGYGWKAGHIITTEEATDHAWNAVYILGEWRFTECTWGAGHLDKNDKFCWQFDDFYFLTDPEDFVHKHFPYFDKDLEASQVWQLLDKPLSLKEFCNSLALQPVALELGLTPLSHSTEVIAVSENEPIRLGYPARNFQSFMCDLYKEDGRNMDSFVMMEGLEESLVVIHLMLPETGNYFLTMYGKPKERDSKTHDSLLTYKIINKANSKKTQKYPIRHQVWGACFDFREYGFADRVSKKVVYVANDGELRISLDTTRDIEIMASVEHAEQVIETPKRYCFVEKHISSVDISVRLPFVGYYKLSVLAKRPLSDQDSYWEAIAYLIDCKDTKNTCPRFPEEYGITQSLNVRLLAPLNGDLPASTKTEFRLKAPSLKRAMVRETMLEKREDDFEGVVMTPEAGETLSIYGSSETGGSLNGLFKYDIV